MLVSALTAGTLASLALAQELVFACAGTAVEKFLNVGDFYSATSLLNIRVKQSAKGSLQEARLRIALMASRLRRNQLVEALSENKRVLALVFQLQKTEDGAQASLCKALYASVSIVSPGLA